MKGTFYNNSDLKSSKGWVRDPHGTKRLLKFKTILSTKTTLVLLNIEYARFAGYSTLYEFLKDNGLAETKFPIWLDPKTGKIYSIVDDQLYNTIKEDPSFKICALFTPNL